MWMLNRGAAPNPAAGGACPPCLSDVEPVLEEDGWFPIFTPGAPLPHTLRIPKAAEGASPPLLPPRSELAQHTEEHRGLCFKQC
jgi:hypothetical protein